MAETIDQRAGRQTFAALLGIHTFSETGAIITLVAFPWFILQLTGSATLTGLSGAALAAAAISSGIFGGVLVDRFGYRRTTILADGFSTIVIVLVPILSITTGINFLVALALIFFARLLDIPALTARRSMLPEISSRAGLPLERSNSYFESGVHIASLVGPISAGMLITVLGSENVFLAAGALIGIAVAATWLFLPSDSGQPEITNDRATGGRFLNDFMEGLRFIRGHRLLLGLLIALGLINMITFPIFSVIVPVYADSVLGSATQLGLLLSIWGFGVLSGTIVYSFIGHRVPRRWIWVAANALMVLPVIGLMLELRILGLAPLFIITSLAYGPLNPMTLTVRHERIPAALRGRVFAVYSAVGFTCAPIGTMFAGSAIDIVGMTATLAGIFTLISLFVLVVASAPVFRQMERSFAEQHPSPKAT